MIISFKTTFLVFLHHMTHALPLDSSNDKQVENTVASQEVLTECPPYVKLRPVQNPSTAGIIMRCADCRAEPDISFAKGCTGSSLDDYIPKGDSFCDPRHTDCEFYPVVKLAYPDGSTTLHHWYPKDWNMEGLMPWYHMISRSEPYKWKTWRTPESKCFLNAKALITDHDPSKLDKDDVIATINLPIDLNDLNSKIITGSKRIRKKNKKNGTYFCKDVWLTVELEVCHGSQEDSVEC